MFDTEPVAEAIEYETVKFNSGDASLTESLLQQYTNLSKMETDLAWWHLYDGTSPAD